MTRGRRRIVAAELAARPAHIVLGILVNKDADGIVRLLVPHALSLTFLAVPGHDSHDPAELATIWGGRAAASLEDALSELGGETLIVGSLYLAGEALRLNNESPE